LVPADGLPETNAHFEPVAWWYTRKKIGRSLAEHYELADDLPLRLLALIDEIDGKPKTSAQVGSVDKPPAPIPSVCGRTRSTDARNRIPLALQ
jgi:hypothetical protein